MIVLASASPRRQTLLKQAGLTFEVEPANVDETLELPAASPRVVAGALAARKARAIAEQYRSIPDVWVIGADTVVALAAGEGWSLLGKPEGEDEARGMLERLSDSRHQVVTGVCVVRTLDGHEYAAAETTWVTMRPLEPAEVEAYVDSGEWRDKAGGYAIQETADAFVTALEGPFDNVVGLPVGLTLQLLCRSGADQVHPFLARPEGGG